VRGQLLQLRPGGIGASVIDDDDFVGNVVKGKLEMEMFDGGGDGALYVTRGNDHGQEAQRLVVWSGIQWSFRG